jgi:hypothetical protein
MFIVTRAEKARVRPSGARCPDHSGGPMADTYT